MRLIERMFFLAGALITIVIGYITFRLTEMPEVPKLKSVWWGAGEAKKVNESVRSFSINIPDEVLHDLKNRLKNHSPLTPPMEMVNFEYGFNTDYLEKVVEFWKTKYNWREREAILNSLPQFKTIVDGLDLHFVHVKPQKINKNMRVLPLLLLHGWPSSVRDLYDMISFLTTPQKDVDFVFEVIAPSLPGFGFSEGASKPGLGTVQTAVVMKDLMERLGFQKFYAQGGDWGAVIVSNMAVLFPENLYGIHSNMCLTYSLKNYLMRILLSFWPTLLNNEALVDKMFPLGKYLSDLILESGYFHLQATKPDTIGVALQDSPVGLAAYMLEKYSVGTDKNWRSIYDGGLTRKFKLTDLLDNVMIYWVTRSITTSMRLYSESFRISHMNLQLERIPTRVSTGCALFPNGIFHEPEFFLQDKYHNLVRYSNMPQGGHFAVLEEPKLLSEEVWETVKIIENKRKIA